MISILKPILLRFLQTTAVKRLVIELLEAYVERTDNTIDDGLVQMVKTKLFEFDDEPTRG